MSYSSIQIIIADLEFKFEKLKKSVDDKSFYAKIADYGKYLIDNKEIAPILKPLYEEAQHDIKQYQKAAKEFLLTPLE